jgi:adenylate cyclase
VAIFEPLGLKEAIDSAEIKHAQLFEQAFAAYQHQQWDQAETLLRALNSEAPRALYDIYLERIAHFRETPPPEHWDGVFVYTTK